MMEEKINGRKRHIITDTQGLILGCYIGHANENDRDGIKPAIDNMLGKYNTISKMWLIWVMKAKI
jgi:putative transposase